MKSHGNDTLSNALSELSERERMVLEAIVRVHIDEKAPVGSKTLVDRLDLSVSSATIRNIMASLAEKSLIEKPHKSAGRIPTARGLRFYIDSVLKLQGQFPGAGPIASEQQMLRDRLASGADFSRSMSDAARVLSDLAQATCVIRAPRENASRLRSLDILEMRPGTYLAVLVTEGGVVQNRAIELSGFERGGIAPGRDDLSRFSRMLTDQVRGQTIDGAREVLERELKADAARLEAWQKALYENAIAMPRDDEVTVEGQRHLLSAKDVEALVSALEEKTQVLTLLDEAATAPGVRVFIGRESGLTEFADMAVVTATYGRDEGVLGSLGVIGPQNMDYARVVPLVAFTADTVSGLFTDDA